MKIGKRGNGLAVRLPQAIVKKLGLKAGDFVEVVALSPHNISPCPVDHPKTSAGRHETPASSGI
jgi:antitoxin component of MazEF toxin-antitoxin module